MSDQQGGKSLLPCPFCGGGAAFEQLENTRWSVGCVDIDGECMGFQSLQTFPRKADAAKAWNTRIAKTDPPAAEGEVTQEKPVAWIYQKGGYRQLSYKPDSAEPEWKPLYAHPTTETEAVTALWNATLELARKATALSAALDGQEQYRTERQGVLDAMEALAALTPEKANG